MAISQRLRFEVLRRDNYTCRYCGAGAPDVEITVDHVIPKALGGTDEPSNLCAACRRCNGGKTSSSPDAPLVADVAEDALQWARAMQAATARMLADLDAREADRDQFQQWWNNWAYGEGEERRTLPLGAGWQQTVDQLVSAGLPLRLLKECIDRAMSRQKVADDQKFRYMCGVAWKKLTELQDAAKAQTRTDGAAPGDEEYELAPATMHGRADLASECLGDFPDDIDRLLAEAREDRGADTENEQRVEAFQILWMEQYHGYAWLAHSVCDLLLRIPDPIVAESLRQARKELYDEHGPGFTRQQFAERTCNLAERNYDWYKANSYLSAMSGDERAEWELFAGSVFGADGQRMQGWSGVVYPATCARAVKERDRYYDGMCQGRGMHIPSCPNKGTHFVQFAELACCQDADGDHDAHLYCDRHFNMAASGGLANKDGPVTVASHSLIREPIEAVPF